MKPGGESRPIFFDFLHFSYLQPCGKRYYIPINADGRNTEMTLNEIIAAIHEDGEINSAAGRNALHGATEGHPWCAGKTLEQRKLEVLFVVAGRRVSGELVDRVRRAAR
jgi:hypothetical protein